MNERLDIQLEFKDRVISKMLLATIDRPVDARSMWTEWNINGRYSISIEGWQRIITKIIEHYQYDCLEKLKNGLRPPLIWAGGSGYYSVKCEPENIQDSVAGLIFYNKKILATFPRRKVFKQIIKYAHEYNVDRKEQPGQTSLAL